MKLLKYFIIILFFLVAIEKLAAQGGFNLSVKGAANYTRIQNQNFIDDEGIEYFPNAGFGGGLAVGYNDQYYNTGYAIEFFYKNYSQTYQYTPDSSVIPSWRNNYKLQYFEIPILLRLRPAGDKRTKTYTYGGAYFEIGVQGSMLLGAAQTDADSLPLRLPNKDISDQFEQFGLAGVIGVGAHQVGLRHWGVSHGIRIVYSILDISNRGKTSSDYIDTKGNTVAYKPFRILSAGYLLSVTYKF